MYDSVTKHNFDSVSDAVNARDTNTGSTKYDQNTKGAHKDIDIKGNIQNDRYDDTVTQRKWSTETNEIDN